MKNITKYIPVLAYLLTIPLANWFIGNVGTQSFPDGPHTIPVGFGYSAPSGVLLIAIALFARDIIQEKHGKSKTIIAICIGVALSYIVNPAVAVASAVAFALGELFDFFVYTKARKKSIALAVALSGIIGGIIDSFIFLQIAFKSTDYWQGQVIGKTIVSLIAGAIIYLRRRK